MNIGRWLLGAAAIAVAGPLAAQPVEHTSKSLYLLKCSGCHRADGQGAVQAGVPPFPGFVGALASDPAGRTYMLHVPGVAGSGLGNSDLARVMNYLLDEWSSAPADRIPRFTPEEVARQRAVPVNDVVSYRRGVVARLRKSGAPVADYPWP